MATLSKNHPYWSENMSLKFDFFSAFNFQGVFHPSWQLKVLYPFTESFEHPNVFKCYAIL